jgi:hypothetical protein
MVCTESLFLFWNWQVSTRLKEMEEAVLERLKTAIMGRMVDTQGDM